MTRIRWAAMLGVFIAAPLAAQSSLAARVGAVRDGRVIMRYATAPDICSSEDVDAYRTNRSRSVSEIGGWTRDDRDCVRGPAWVAITRTAGETVSLHMRVGYAPSHERDDVDLGVVPPADAAHYLIGIARTLGASNANRSLAAAAAADAPGSGQDFLALAVETPSAPIELRKQALFWAGQSELPVDQLVAVYSSLRDASLREQFTFVLSQRREPGATQKLIEIAQHDDNRQVQRQAIFWLGQSRDPKARQFLIDLMLR